MRLIVDLAPSDPAEGLARDEALFESVCGGGENLVRLWVNDRAIVIGRSQHIASEVDLAAARSEGVKVLRRISGGGAVYHYPGNLNVSVVVESGAAVGSVSDVFSRFGGMIRDGLGMLGLDAGLRGHRILVSNRKLGGGAQARRGRGVLFHSTLLVLSADAPMERFLLAHRRGYRTGGVASRPEETVTMTEALGRPIGIDEAANAVREGFARDCALELDRLSEDEAARARVLVETKYGRARWNGSR